jgi:hypothetical protein
MLFIDHIVSNAVFILPCKQFGHLHQLLFHEMGGAV